MDSYFYNNIGICSLSIVSIVKENNNELELSKVPLIMPIVAHKQLLNYMSSKSSVINSLDGLIISKYHFFSNFNKKFYEFLPLTLNTIQFLVDIEIIELSDNKIYLLKEYEYEKTMGTRVEKIFKASKNIVKILDENNEKLYLNLRVEL